jgi:hypothetical protein
LLKDLADEAEEQPGFDDEHNDDPQVAEHGRFLARKDTTSGLPGATDKSGRLRPRGMLYYGVRAGYAPAEAEPPQGPTTTLDPADVEPSA